jgi:hypothetical protein
MATMFSRVVTEMAPGPDGVLGSRPGVLWRSEPARGETGIHRKLAGLVGASDSRIASFASTYGPLRLGTAPLQAAPGAIVRGAFMRVGHELLDDVARVRGWLEVGSRGPAPHNVADLLAVADWLASLPDRILRGWHLLQEGASEADIEVVLGPGGFDPAPYIGGMLESTLAHGGRPFDRSADRERLARAVDLLEWLGRILGGIDDEPEASAALGGSAEAMRTLLVNMPEAFAHPELADDRSIEGATLMADFAAESVADWREAADALAARIEAASLVYSALEDGLTEAEKGRLASVYRSLTSSEPAASLTAAELAERTQPLLIASVEAELERGGAWPIRRGSPLGLYWRALVALRTELTEQGPLIRCARAGCPGRFTLTRNRRFCDDCQVERGREAVARVRAKVARIAEQHA